MRLWSLAQSWPRLVLGHADAGVFDGQGGVGLVRDDLHRTNADPTDLQDSRDPHGTPGPLSDASTRRLPNPELKRLQLKALCKKRARAPNPRGPCPGHVSVLRVQSTTSVGLTPDFVRNTSRKVLDFPRCFVFRMQAHQAKRPEPAPQIGQLK